MKQTIAIVAVGVAALLALFFAFNAYIYSEKQGDDLPVEPYRATLSGTRVCLPHKGEGPHTKECALGMKTDVGEHYVLDFSRMSQVPLEIESGARFTASGVITPIENLSTDQWMTYDVAGVFSVTDSVVVDDIKEPVNEPMPVPGKCYVGGCSSQLCGDTPGMVSTCEYRDAYACYQTATCERQVTGECGWTPSQELTTCLTNAN